jgi:hypothetical protein
LSSTYVAKGGFNGKNVTLIVDDAGIPIFYSSPGDKVEFKMTKCEAGAPDMSWFGVTSDCASIAAPAATTPAVSVRPICAVMDEASCGECWGAGGSGDGDSSGAAATAGPGWVLVAVSAITTLAATVVLV